MATRLSKLVNLIVGVGDNDDDDDDYWWWNEAKVSHILDEMHFQEDDDDEDDNKRMNCAFIISIFGQHRKRRMIKKSSAWWWISIIWTYQRGKMKTKMDDKRELTVRLQAKRWSQEMLLNFSSSSSSSSSFVYPLFNCLIRYKIYIKCILHLSLNVVTILAAIVIFIIISSSHFRPQSSYLIWR